MAEDEIPPEVKKDLLKEGWTQPEAKTSKVPANKTSKVPTEMPATAPKNYVCEICSKPFDTPRALTGHMSVHSKKSLEPTEAELPEEYLDEQETLGRIIAEATPTRKRKAIVRMVSRHLGNKRESVETLMEALRLADIPVHLRNLIVGNWASHMDIPDIEDVLDPEKKEEKKKAEEKKTEEDEEKEKEKTSVDPVKEVFKKYRVQKAERLEDKMDAKAIAEMEKEMGGGKEEDGEEKHTLIVDGVSLSVTPEQMLAWKRFQLEEKKAEEEREERKAERKRQDEERRQRESELKAHNGDGLVEWVIGEGNNTKTVKVRPETIPLLIQSQGVKEVKNPHGSPPSKEEVMQMVENLFDARSKKITTEDVQRIVRDETSKFQVGLTKDDLDYLKAKDQYRLEERKLDDKSKSRDEFAKIARSATSQVGQILARTLTESGAITGTPTKGIADQTGTVIQVACPGCGAAITSPITENMIQCSQCGRQYTVERPPDETLPPPTPAPVAAHKTLPVETPEKPVHVKPEEEFTPKEKERIQRSMEDAKAGRITPLEPSEPTTDIKKIAENLAVGEGVKYLEELLKKEGKLVEKKPRPKITSNICPIAGCGKKCKSKVGVGLHIDEVHPEYVLGIKKQSKVIK